MARKNAFDRLATAAARIDTLQKQASTLAGRMLRTYNPAKLEAQAKAGRRLDRQIKAASVRFREIERSLLRTTPRERKQRAETQRREAEHQLRQDEESRARALVAQTFTIRGSYHSRKNHGVSLEVKLTYIGLPLDEKKDERRIKDAVRALADGREPSGGNWEVATVEYGPTVERRVMRGEGDFRLLGRAISDPDFKLTVVGEDDI